MSEGVELLAARDGLVVVFSRDESPLGTLAPLVLLDGPHQVREGIAANSGQLLAKPSRSGPAPFDYNQPCAGTQPCTGGGQVAQLFIHGTADGSIHYDGGPRLGR